MLDQALLIGTNRQDKQLYYIWCYASGPHMLLKLWLLEDIYSLWHLLKSKVIFAALKTDCDSFENTSDVNCIPQTESADR